MVVRRSVGRSIRRKVKLHLVSLVGGWLVGWLVSRSPSLAFTGIAVLRLLVFKPIPNIGLQTNTKQHNFWRIFLMTFNDVKLLKLTSEES